MKTTVVSKLLENNAIDTYRVTYRANMTSEESAEETRLPSGRIELDLWRENREMLNWPEVDEEGLLQSLCRQLYLDLSGSPTPIIKET